MQRYLKIPKREQEELLKELCETISVLKNPQEIMSFITDLFTKQEIIMLAKRIKIAKFLLEGKSYRDIKGTLKVGFGTVTRVNHWLTESGEGFRLIAERTKKEKPKVPTSWDLAMEDWKKFMKAHPLIFWPQLLLEDIIKIMNNKQKQKLAQVIKKLEQKSYLYKQIDKILRT